MSLVNKKANDVLPTLIVRSIPNLKLQLHQFPRYSCRIQNPLMTYQQMSAKGSPITYTHMANSRTVLRWLSNMGGWNIP